MKSLGRWHAKIGCICTFVLVLFVTGCGGGGGDDADTDTDTDTSPAVVLSLKADAGKIIGIRVGDTASLDGSASTAPASDPITYAWSFTHKPQASKTAVLTNANSVNPTFVPDVAGTYMVQLVVTSGGISSQRAIALVEASIPGDNYTGLRIHTSYTSKCSTCHDGRYLDPNTNPGLIAPKSGDHLGVSNVCEACHTTFGFNLIRFVDHEEVFGACSTCHDGNPVIGKSSFHVVTNAECSDCHKSTTSFFELGVDGTFDHTGITKGCIACHNGKTAIGDSGSQIHLNNPDVDCSLCHNTTSFAEAYPDHNVILNNVIAGSDTCSSCHGAAVTGPQKATPPTAGHPDTSFTDCNTCHSITQFSLGGTFNHRVDASVVPCKTCHTEPNSINAIGKTNIPIHNTTADCGVCHGTKVDPTTGKRSFKNATIDHSLPSVVAERCDSCHGVTAIGLSTDHIQTQTTPTIVDCDACHTPGNFSTGTFDHSVTNIGTLVCSDCHNGTNTAGKHVTHIPTTAECDVCHFNTNTFTGAVFDHTGITNNCASCHDGNISKGKHNNHLPTTRDCADCHAGKFDNFVGGTFDHVGIDPNNCGSCHDGVVALGKHVTHIPAQKECSQCHIDTNTGGFVNSTFKADVHSLLTNGCEGCHTAKFSATKWTSFLKSDSTNHVPTNQDCHSCHSNVDFTDITQFTHAGITGNCESCHDGNYYNNVTGPKAVGKANPVLTPPHPPTTADCGICHGVGNNFTDGIFDHTGVVDNCSSCHGDGQPGAITKMNNGHVPTTQDCGVCHVTGTFATAVFNHTGIVDNCASCHDGTGATATVKTPTHLPTTQDCADCHNTTAFAGAKFDHKGIVGSCTTCHDGVTATGKDGKHVPTNKDCDVCHKTTGFIPGTFDHTGIVDNCESCHDGALAIGKNNGHVATTADCGLCHNTKGFTPATFDHSNISNATRCDSCHGVNATGMDAKTNPNHLPTALDCRDCHSTATFAGGSWVHDGTTAGTCDTCHNGTDAEGKSGGHFSTNVQCDVCHTTNSWAPTSFSHDPQGDYPGDHNTDPGCSGCHGNTVTTPFVYPDSQYAPTCAACHANDYELKGPHKNTTVKQNMDCSGGGKGCHKVDDRKW